jgi:hypothetical protein
MRRLFVSMVVACGLVLAGSSAAWACGSLVAPNGAVRLVRTTTLAAYHDGVEHYVTNFQFVSPKTSFGSIIPLPAAPTDVRRGGDWTLQRLEREVSPIPFEGRPDVLAASAAGVQVLQQVQIDALQVTVLRGGGKDVAAWAAQQGFTLTPDTPSVLEFYSRRSPFFLAAKYDASAAVARGLRSGDGTPVQLTIPVPAPWVPLRILGTGKPADEVVNADVFLLTDTKPDLLTGQGLSTERSEPASPLLLHDLRSDRNTSWVPDQAWLTFLRLSQPAGRLGYDLAVGVGHPARLADTGVAVSAVLPLRPGAGGGDWPVPVALGGVVTAAALVVALRAGRRRGRAAMQA